MKNLLSQPFSFEDLPEFDSHKLVTYVHHEASGLKGFIAIHKGSKKVPALGATRFWRYDSEVEALRDALRLSRLMSYKSALAGLRYGGAKGVIIKNSIPKDKRRHALQAYANRVDYLDGHFITGTDVGLEQRDLKVMREKTPYLIGLSTDSSIYTAIGIYQCIQAALTEVYGTRSMRNRSIAIQGVGKVGMELLRRVHPYFKEVYIADINRAAIKKAQRLFPGVQVVPTADIHKQDVDIFSPCALSGAINKKTIKQLRCKIVLGGANNQLTSKDMGTQLHRAGILYAPDYVVNSGGFISVVDEYQNKKHDEERLLRRISKIRRTLQEIFEMSREQKAAPPIVADELAEEIIEANHTL